MKARTRRKRTGRPKALNVDLALTAGFAHGRGVSLEVVAGVLGVSPSTLRRSFNAGLTDPRAQRLASIVSDLDWERENSYF